MHDGMSQAHIYNEPQHEKGYTYEYSNESGCKWYIILAANPNLHEL